ncbi:MAG: hypothetical protein A2234_10205 [Elusimicrobia bacterium RIFOXYA2_FULL_58_8]|nr:MAG: hypothetical protein A2285_04535 [Elusimicrobia bacterium RIFOXYA12_FULL_57_11]OGS14489.1 MAG: hypothetical protein A2234_10205 [Elusimicrobia bacterium RIFOXYA2_FULL_58_8]
MAQNRDNCVILLVSPPEQEKINQELKTAFGPERAAHVNGDLLLQAYKTLKNFSKAILLLSYEKTPQHPDLTWLDPEDPGFLEFKTKPLEERIRDVFQLAFFTGAKKAILIDHLSPEIKGEWLGQALDALNDKTVALGANQDGSLYLLGLTQQNIKLLETPGFTAGKSAELMAERAKKSKLSLFSSPETYCVRSEDSLRKWLEHQEAAPQFSADQAASPAPLRQETEHRRHVRRHPKGHENHPFSPPQENTPLP